MRAKKSEKKAVSPPLDGSPVHHRNLRSRRNYAPNERSRLRTDELKCNVPLNVHMQTISAGQKRVSSGSSYPSAKRSRKEPTSTLEKGSKTNKTTDNRKRLDAADDVRNPIRMYCVLIITYFSVNIVPIFSVTTYLSFV